MSVPDDFFIGWQAKAPPKDRRFLLGAALGLIGAAAGAGAGFAMRRPGASPARWDQSAIAHYEGVLVETPYPTLLTQGPDGAVSAMLLVGYGKIALTRLNTPPAQVALEASAIERGPHRMLAIPDAEAFAAAPRAPTAWQAAPEEDLGPVMRIGEILDAKCWFGAMNPGFGLTHKACAALCARGGLPLAFCPVGECAEGEELCLFLDEHGGPHEPGIIPFLADPVFADGRLVRRNGLLEYRVAAAAVRRV